MLDIAARNVSRVSCALRVVVRRGGRRAGSKRSSSRVGVVAVAVTLLLAACSGPGVGTGQTASVAAAPAAIAAPVAKRPLLDVAQLASLKTLSTQALVARLGEPDFTRRDPPAEIWQYRGSTCVLDVFLYPEEGEMKVLLAATRDRDRLQAPENNCTPFGPTRSASAGS
jgi:hypothetical protein